MMKQKSDLTTSSNKKKESSDLVPRFWFCLLFTFPFFVRNLEPSIQWLLATIVLFMGNWTFFYSVYREKISIYTLYSVAVLVLYLYSLVGKFPLYGTMCAITVLFLLIQIVEQAIDKQKDIAIEKKKNMAPKSAFKLLIDGRTEEIPVDLLKVGDTIRIQQKDVIACDGILFSGESEVDESPVTGNKKSVLKVVGSDVLAGSKVLKGSAFVRATKTAKESVYEKVLANTEALFARKLPLENRVGLFSSQVIIGSIVLGVIVFLFGSLFSEPSNAILMAVSLLIGLSPSALLFSSSLLSKLAIAEAANEGIVVQNPKAFDDAASCTMLVVNKNGTLTYAKPSIVSIDPVEDVKPHELLVAAASLEALSKHPYARCIVEKAREDMLTLDEVTSLEEVPGLGIRANIGQETLRIGDEKLMEGIDLGYYQRRAEDMRNQGYIVLFCAKGKKLLGTIVLSDPVRGDVVETLQAFKGDGFGLFCLSGDSRVTVVQLVNALGFDRFQAEANPIQKVETIKKLQREGKKILLIDNNPELSRIADCGCIFASKVAVDASITLLGGSLASLQNLVALSQSVKKIWMQNSVALYLFMGLMLILSLSGSIGPTYAALYLLLATVAVGINSLRVVR